MSRYASVVIRNPRKTKKPTSHNLRHNSRLTPDPNYMLPRELRLKNYNLYTVSDSTKTWDDWQIEIGDLYKEQHLKGRQIRSDAVRLDEGLIVLSEEQVDNCNADDIWEKMQEYINWFEERFMTVVYTLDWHRDEGHSEEDLDEVQKLETRNNHAHFIFSNVDTNGDMIRRNWDKKGTEFKEMQDQIAKIFKPLGFVRGVNYAKNKILPPEYKTPSEKRREKSKETRKKDKIVIKNLTDMLNKEKEKKWQPRLKKLREKIQLEKVNRSKYVELEALFKMDAINYKNAEMKNEAIAENIIWDIKVEWEQEKQVLQEKITEKVNELEELEESSADLVETKGAKISELQGDITFHQIIDEQRVEKINTLQTEIENHKKYIKDNVTQIEELESATLTSETQHKEKIEVKDNEILALSQEVQGSKKDVFSETWTSTSTDGKKYKSKNIDVVKYLESENKELNEDIETLKTQNNTLNTSIKEKETQITSDSNSLKESQGKIKVLKEQVKELENLKPVIKEVKVIKEIPAKITIDDVKSFEVKEDGENITLIDLFNRKNKAIKELKEHNTSLATNTKEKDALIAVLEQEIESNNAWIYTGEIHEVLDVSETYIDEVHETWRDKAKELEEKVEKLEDEISLFQNIKEQMNRISSKVLKAFKITPMNDNDLEEIERSLDKKLLLFKPPEKETFSREGESKLKR